MSYDWYGSKQYTVQKDQEGVDAWLREYVGHGNWCEWIGLRPTPVNYRSFSFKDPKHETMFILRWM